MSNNSIVIYTDGSCEVPRGGGGWGVHIEKEDGTIAILSGNANDTTNNRMELTAVIEALSSLVDRSRVLIYCDSQYVVDSINKGWIKKWKNNGWMTAGFKEKNIPPSPVKNKDLFEKLDDLLAEHDVQIKWIKAHADSELNNKVDQIAKDEMKKVATGKGFKPYQKKPYNPNYKKPYNPNYKKPYNPNYKKPYNSNYSKPYNQQYQKPPEQPRSEEAFQNNFY